MSIDIANESGVEVDETDLAAVARFALDQLRIHPLAELSVLLVDERAMAELHEKYMDESGPTDVLAFPMDELRPPGMGGNRAEDADEGPDELLGDVVLCLHGILHLLGYDHAEPEEHAAMFGTQDRLLRSWRDARRAEGPGTRP